MSGACYKVIVGSGVYFGPVGVGIFWFCNAEWISYAGAPICFQIVVQTGRRYSLIHVIGLRVS